MFKIGDLVEIHYNDERTWFPMEGSPVMNLEGTIARISEIRKMPYKEGYYYVLEFLEIHAKDPNKFEDSMTDLMWQDKHLILHKTIEIKIDDILNLLKEDR